LNLGGRFHRSRIRLISSQVSTIASEWSGRWTKSRRLHLASEMLQHVRPAQLITHRFPLDQASQAYALLDQHPEEAIQVLFTYGEQWGIVSHTREEHRPMYSVAVERDFGIGG